MSHEGFYSDDYSNNKYRSPNKKYSKINNILNNNSTSFMYNNDINNNSNSKSILGTSSDPLHKRQKGIERRRELNRQRRRISKLNNDNLQINKIPIPNGREPLDLAFINSQIQEKEVIIIYIHNISTLFLY